MRVVVGTGGTAGHVFPALAMASALRERTGAVVIFVGRSEGQEARLVPQAGFTLETVEALPFVRALSPAALRAPVAALRAAGQCRRIVRGADVVVGMGGYVSVPVALAARREGVPLAIHEQNAVPGLANRLAARWARVVALSFEEAGRRFPRRLPKVVTGNPVRAPIMRVPSERERLRAEGLQVLGLDTGRRTAVLFGGSQGALRLNQAAADAARILAGRADLQLLLLTGSAHHARVRELLPSGGPLLVRTVSFLERMELAYAVADAMVSRAGATTVAELSACGIPAVLVPYPHATGRHQEANARALERAGGAVVVPDRDVTGSALAEVLTTLLDDDARLAAMAGASAAFGRPNAATALADVSVSLVRGGR